MELQDAKKYLHELIDGEYPAPHGISELDLDEIRRNIKFIDNLLSVDGIRLHLKRVFGSTVVPDILFPDGIKLNNIDLPKRNLSKQTVNGVDLSQLSMRELRLLHNALRKKAGLEPLEVADEPTGKRGRPKGSTNGGERKPKPDAREPKPKKNWYI
jgi:hypothetical protein